MLKYVKNPEFRSRKRLKVTKTELYAGGRLVTLRADWCTIWSTSLHTSQSTRWFSSLSFAIEP